MKLKSRTSSQAPARSRSQVSRTRSSSRQNTRGLLRDLNRLAKHKKKAFQRMRQVYKLRQQKLKQLNQLILRKQQEQKKKAKKNHQRHKRKLQYLFEKMKKEMRSDLAQDQKTLNEQKKKRNLLLKKFENLKRQTKTVPQSRKIFKGVIKRCELALSGLLPMEQILNKSPRGTKKYLYPMENMSPKLLECVQSMMPKHALSRQDSRLIIPGPYKVTSKHIHFSNAPFVQVPYTVTYNYHPLTVEAVSPKILGPYSVPTQSDPIRQSVSRTNKILSIRKKIPKNLPSDKPEETETIEKVVKHSTKDKVSFVSDDRIPFKSSPPITNKAHRRTRFMPNAQMGATILKKLEQSKDMRSTISKLRKALSSDFRMMSQLEASLKAILKRQNKKLKGFEKTHLIKAKAKPKTMVPSRQPRGKIRKTPSSYSRTSQRPTSSRGPSRQHRNIPIPKSPPSTSQSEMVEINPKRGKKRLKAPSPRRRTKFQNIESDQPTIPNAGRNSNKKLLKFIGFRKSKPSQINFQKRFKDNTQGSELKLDTEKPFKSHTTEGNFHRILRKPPQFLRGNTDQITKGNDANSESRNKKVKLSAEIRKSETKYETKRKSSTVPRGSSDTLTSERMRESMRSAALRRPRESSSIIPRKESTVTLEQDSTRSSALEAINMVALFDVKQKIGTKITRSMLSFLSDVAGISLDEEEEEGEVSVEDPEVPKIESPHSEIVNDISPTHSDDLHLPFDIDPNMLIVNDPAIKDKKSGILTKAFAYKTNRIMKDLESGALDKHLHGLAGARSEDFKKVYQLLIQDKMPYELNDLNLLNKYLDEYLEMLDKLHKKRLQDCTTTYEKVLADADFQGTRRQMSDRMKFIQHSLPYWNDSMYMRSSETNEQETPQSVYDVESLRTQWLQYFKSQAKTSFQMELERRRKLLRGERMEKRRIQRELRRARSRSRSQSQKRLRLCLHYCCPRLTSRQQKVEELIQSGPVKKVPSKCSICGLTYCGSYSDVNVSENILPPPNIFPDPCKTLQCSWISAVFIVI